MPEFKIQCSYLRTEKRKFFNDRKSKEYYGFLVDNPQIIPDEHVYLTKKRDNPCWIWILDDFIKKVGIDFSNPRAKWEFKFVINLGEKRAAKFNTNNRNWMVLKTKDYFENTVKKIGFLDSEDYFYENNKSNSPQPANIANPVKDKDISNLIQIAFFIVVLFIMLAIFLYFVFKQSLSRKEKK